MSFTRTTSVRLATAAALASITLGLVGCGNGPATDDPAEPAEPASPTKRTAIAFAQTLYRDVLTGQPGVCERFTNEGQADFVADMDPAVDCTEAADALSAAVKDYDAFTANLVYSVEYRTRKGTVVRADFGDHADLMRLEWVDGQWMAGPTARVMSNQVSTTEDPDHGHDTGHDHDHDHDH